MGQQGKAAEPKVEAKPEASVASQPDDKGDGEVEAKPETGEDGENGDVQRKSAGADPARTQAA